MVEARRDAINTILELAGVVRYVHCSLMVFGHVHIPIREQHIAEVEKMIRKPGELRAAG